MSKFSLVLFLCLSFLSSLSADLPSKVKISRIIAKNRFPSWMMQQINADLDAFSSEEYSKQALDAVMADFDPDAGIVRFQVKAGVVEVDMRCVRPVLILRATILKHVFEWLVKEINLPNLDCICCVHDKGFSEFSTPVFAFARKGMSRDVLIPDFEMLDGYGQLSRSVLEASSNSPWKQKQEIAFWRGSTTGGIYTPTNWTQFPRSQLVLLSLRHPKKIDARFTSLCQGAEENYEMRLITKLLGAPVSQVDSLAYKYLVDIDGNTCGYQRLYWTLLSNCAVFKQVSDDIQWYYGALHPYKHYIPFANDCSDLLEKIEWARAHDSEVKKIADNGTRFAIENLQHEQSYAYLYLLLKAYAERQKEVYD